MTFGISLLIVWALKRDAGLCFMWKYCCSDRSCHHFPAFCPSGTERHHIWVEKNCIWCRVWQQHRPWQWNRETQSHVHQGLQDAGIHCMHLDCEPCEGNLSNLHRSCGEIRNRNSCFLYLTSISEFRDSVTLTLLGKIIMNLLMDCMQKLIRHSLEAFPCHMHLCYEELGISLSSRKFR